MELTDFDDAPVTMPEIPLPIALLMAQPRAIFCAPRVKFHWTQRGMFSQPVKPVAKRVNLFNIPPDAPLVTKPSPALYG